MGIATAMFWRRMRLNDNVDLFESFTEARDKKGNIQKEETT